MPSSSARAGRPPTVKGFRATISRVVGLLRRDPAVGAVTSPPAAGSIAPGGRVAVVRGGAAAGPAEMVRAASRLRDGLEGAAAPGIEVSLTGSAGLWSEFNEQNRAAMLRSEVMSWPVTLIVRAVAFGSLAAAGIPLLLAVLGLIAAAGTLWIGAQFTAISIWAMNFALMFALAVGIDYALFVVVRFRAAADRTCEPTMRSLRRWTALGGQCSSAAMAVLASLAAVMLVPSQPFRTSALGILLAVGFVLAASLTLLPAPLAHLGPRLDRFALPWAGAVQHRSEPFARWGWLIWRRPALLGALALAVLIPLAVTGLGLRTAMPTIGVLPANASARVVIEFLRPVGYPELLELIKAHGYDLARERGELPSAADVAADWYDRVYLPGVAALRREAMHEAHDYKTDADMFLCVYQRRGALRVIDGRTDFGAAARDARNQRVSRRFRRRFLRERGRPLGRGA